MNLPERSMDRQNPSKWPNFISPSIIEIAFGFYGAAALPLNRPASLFYSGLKYSTILQTPFMALLILSIPSSFERVSAYSCLMGDLLSLPLTGERFFFGTFLVLNLD